MYYAGKSAGVISIPLKGIKSIFFTSIPDEKLKQFPVTVTAGCYLRGSLTLIKDNAAVSHYLQYNITVGIILLNIKVIMSHCISS